MPKTFIICMHLGGETNIGYYYARFYEELGNEGRKQGFTISRNIDLKHGPSGLPHGLYKATGTGSIGELTGIAESAARVAPDHFVFVCEIPDSPESVRLSPLRPPNPEGDPSSP